MKVITVVNFLVNLGVVAVIVLIGISPFLVSGIAGAIASANDCILHEGGPNPCLNNGTDYGDNLYTMGVTGWLFLLTFPLAGILFAVYVLAWLVIIAVRIWRGRKKRLEGAAV